MEDIRSNLIQISFQGSTIFWYYTSVTLVEYFPDDYIVIENEDLQVRGANAAKAVQRYVYHYDSGEKKEIQIPELIGNWPQHSLVPH